MSEVNKKKPIRAKIVLVFSYHLILFFLRISKSLNECKNRTKSVTFLNFFALNFQPFSLVFVFYKRWNDTVSPAITIDTILISLMSILRDGPEVSLNGSPTVSPTTVAL